MKVWSLILTLVMVMASLDAEAARRMGSGRSFGKQSSNVTQREAAPAAPAAPTQNATNSAVKPAGAAPAAAAAEAALGCHAGRFGRWSGFGVVGQFSGVR